MELITLHVSKRQKKVKGKSNIDNPQTKQPWDKTQQGDKQSKITTQKQVNGKSNIDNPQTKESWDKTQKGDKQSKITTQKKVKGK